MKRGESFLLEVVSQVRQPRAATNLWKNAWSKEGTCSSNGGRILWRVSWWRSRRARYSPSEVVCLPRAWTNARFTMSLQILGLKLQIWTPEETSIPHWHLKTNSCMSLQALMVDNAPTWSRSLTSRNVYIGRRSISRSKRTRIGSVLKAVGSSRFQTTIWLFLEGLPLVIRRQTTVTSSTCIPTK